MKRRDTQGMWKRIQSEGDEATSYIVAITETGSKRKGTMPLKEVQEEARFGKKRKKWRW